MEFKVVLPYWFVYTLLGLLAIDAILNILLAILKLILLRLENTNENN